MIKSNNSRKKLLRIHNKTRMLRRMKRKKIIKEFYGASGKLKQKVFRNEEMNFLVKEFTKPSFKYLFFYSKCDLFVSALLSNIFVIILKKLFEYKFLFNQYLIISYLIYNFIMDFQSIYKYIDKQYLKDIDDNC